MIASANFYTHLFDEIRHSHEVRSRLAASAFAEPLDVEGDGDAAVTIPPPDPSGARRQSARERAAARWGFGTEARPETT